ncbi:hypothetical protein [Thermaurantiacus tibetensis]|uniref:hypothetical protein n=1 Tax=Thermaurantiacus tibetensis TaxID=2759035 RepID=UPI001F2518D2|nr:hypothetical protein [Thermaurantiacus tibetensis]
MTSPAPTGAGNRAAVAAAMPSLLAHEGVWEGEYLHLDADGALLDRHHARVECHFPDDGPFHYVQRNLFRWADGRERSAELPGVLREGRLWWDVQAFAGCAWEGGEGVILLRLDRRDAPGLSFTEAIVLGEGGKERARTWHWFRGGRLVRRTLCAERRVAGPG